MDPATPARWVAAADIPRVPGKFGSALQLNGGSPANYVQLPQGIVTGLTDFTIAAWVNPAAAPQLVAGVRPRRPARPLHVPDRLGRRNQHPPVRDHHHRERPASSGWTPRPPSARTSGRHLAVTLAGTTATLYVNGAAVDTNTSMTLNPTSLGPTTQNYVGKSQCRPTRT